MKIKFLLSGLALLFCVAGCAGDKAEMEEARYLAAKGDVNSAAQAVAILGPKLSEFTGPERVEAYKIYSGALMQKAGIDSIRILSTVVYRSSDDTIALTREALATLTSDSKTLMAEAKTKLAEIIADTTHFSSASPRDQKGIYLQLGLAQFFDALRIGIQVSGLTDGNFDVSICSNPSLTAVTVAELNTLSDDLSATTGAKPNFTSAGLDSTNGLVKLVDTMSSAVLVGSAADLTQLCNYINDQKNL